MNKTVPDDFMIWVETLRKSINKKVEAKAADAAQEAAADQDQSAVAEAEEVTADDIVSYVPCIDNNTMNTHKS